MVLLPGAGRAVITLTNANDWIPGTTALDHIPVGIAVLWLVTGATRLQKTMQSLATQAATTRPAVQRAAA
jgi:hypothetical protein